MTPQPHQLWQPWAAWTEKAMEGGRAGRRPESAQAVQGPGTISPGLLFLSMQMLQRAAAPLE